MSAVADPVSHLLDNLRALLQETAFPAGRWQYSEQNEMMSPSEFSALITRLPHIALAWTGWRSDGVGQRNYKGALNFRVWIVVKHPELKGRLRGDPRGPGLYASAIRAAQLLHGHMIRDIGTVALTSIAPAYAEGFANEHLALAVIEGGVMTTLGDAGGIVAGLPDFTGLAVDWELARQTGSATAPDAEDEITLPGATG